MLNLVDPGDKQATPEFLIRGDATDKQQEKTLYDECFEAFPTHMVVKAEAFVSRCHAKVAVVLPECFCAR